MDAWAEHFARASFRRSGDTAHDLKTPLNVAVLNLELLRMRLRKLVGEKDEDKAFEYARSIEVELRRMARIFDVFFLLSVPPKNEPEPAVVDIAPLVVEAARSAGLPIEIEGAAPSRVHESRIRQALEMFFQGTTKALRNRSIDIERGSSLSINVAGELEPADLEITRLFKFYYTDSSGEPDLSLAAARLIIETYGGELNASDERGKVLFRISVPLENK